MTRIGRNARTFMCVSASPVFRQPLAGAAPEPGRGGRAREAAGLATARPQCIVCVVIVISLFTTTIDITETTYYLISNIMIIALLPEPGPLHGS